MTTWTIVRGRARLLIAIAASVALAAWVLRGLDLGAFAAALREAEYVWLLPAVAVYFLGVAARTWRWHYMLRHLRPIGLWPLFRLVCIGYMGNNIYPARAGELLRSYMLRREHGIRMSASLATVLVERLFDGLVMLLFVFIALPFVSVNDALAAFRGPIAALTIAFVGALVVFLAVAARPALARRLYAPLIRRFLPEAVAARALAVMERFLLGLESLARGREVVAIFATSVLVWLFETAKYWFVMHAFPFDVSFFVLMLMNGIVNLATTIPGLPGHWLTFDAPGIAVLVAAGVDQDVATAYTLVLHVALWLPITALGALFLSLAHLSPRAVREALERDDAGAAPAPGPGGG